MLQLASLGVSPRCREASFSSVRLEIELLGWRREELGLGGHCMLFVGIIDYVGCDCCLFVCLLLLTWSWVSDSGFRLAQQAFSPPEPYH